MEILLDGKAENIKDAIKGTAQESKETIRTIIDSNTKHIDSALDSNKKIVDSIKEKLNEQKIEDVITDKLQDTFGKSVKISEEALDSIINSYTRQMEYNINFNTKLMDAINESTTASPEKILNLIQKNFEASGQLTINNTKELLDFYNKHTNLIVDFNQKFGDNINAQIESFFKMQNKGMNKFTEWASEWWKQTEKEAVL